jgi:hypothetical protein
VDEIEAVLLQVEQRYAGFVPERMIAAFAADQVSDCAY